MAEDGKITQVGGGAGPLSLLGVLFVGLKLTGFIDWSWWWVTAPFWGLPALILAFLAVGLVIAGFYFLVKAIWQNRH